MSIMSTEEETRTTTCSTNSCEEEAIIYCEGFQQFMCYEHKQIHDGFAAALHQDIPIDAYLEEKQDAKVNRYCQYHVKYEVNFACMNCYQPLCDLCIDQPIDTCPLNSKKHRARSLRYTVDRVKDIVKLSMSELKIHQLQMSSSLEELRKIVDNQLDVDRDLLDEIDKSVEQMKLVIEQKGDELKQQHRSEMVTKQEELKKVEMSSEEFGEQCSQAIQRVETLLKRNDIVILLQQDQEMNKLTDLQKYLLPEFEIIEKCLVQPAEKRLPFPVLQKVSLTTKVSLRELQRRELEKLSLQVPTRKNLPDLDASKGNLSTAVPGICNVAIYLSNGRLLHAGDYPLRGSNFTPLLPPSEIIDLYEYREELYVLTKESTVHIVNTQSRTTKVSVISCIGLDQLAVTEEYLCATNSSEHVINVFSRTTYKHLFNISVGWLSSYDGPMRALSDSSLVVGEFDEVRKGALLNITVSKTPKVKWACCEIEAPWAITVDQTNNHIYIASKSPEPHITILSYQGKLLRKQIKFPQCSDIYSISFHNRSLALVNWYCNDDGNWLGGDIQEYHLKWEES